MDRPSCPQEPPQKDLGRRPTCYDAAATSTDTLEPVDGISFRMKRAAVVPILGVDFAHVQRQTTAS